MTHIGMTGFQNLVGDIGIVGWAEQRRDIQPESSGTDRQKLEIAGMGGEEDMRLFFVAQALENGNAIDLDQAGFV